MADIFINIPGSGAPSWKAAVPSASDLPISGNNGDARITQDTDTIYVWNGSTWVAVATPGAAIALDGLIGDVLATGPGTAPATVAFVGGVSAGSVATGANAANAATSSNTPNTIVKRDGSGSFSAGAITLSSTISASNFSGSSSGANTGDVTIGTANGLSLAPTQVLSLGLSSGATNGALSSTDWNTFNNKQNALTFGNLTDTGTDGIVITGGTGAVIGTGTSIAQTKSDVSHNGYLSSTDWTTFNNKLSTIPIGLIDSQTASSNGLVFTGGTLYAQSASITNPGMVNNTIQSFSGNKTFTGQTSVSNTSTTAFTVNSTSLVVDATNNAVGIGIAPSATAVLDIINNSGATKAIQVTGYGSNVGFRGRQANGTLSLPTATLSGNIISFFSARGYGTTGFAAASTGAINISAGANFTDTSMPTYIAFNTTPSASVTSVERLRINSTGNVLIGTIVDNGNNLLQVNGSFLAGSFALTDAANIATNAALANRFTVTLGGNRNLSAPTNPTDGQKVVWIFTQDGTGGRTLTFDASFDFGNLPSLILSSAAGKRDYMGAIYNTAASKWDVVAYSTSF
jgi:hypothetical protein